MDEQKYWEIYNRTKEGKENEYEIKDEMLYKKKGQKQLKIIRRYEMEGIMYIMHDHPLSAHFGIQATYDRTKERYYWKGMKRDIEVYVKSCDQCQRRERPKGQNELHSIRTKAPFYQIGIDIVGPLPVTDKGNRYIVVAMDYFTKWPEAKALPDATAKEVSNFIYEDIICRHGCPEKIISDRGTHFNNQIMDELMKKFQIKHRFSTPYHPQTNGLVERFNRTLCESLAKLSDEGKDWDRYISSVLFAYRTKQHGSTEIQPFYLMYGRNVRMTKDEDDKEITLTEWIGNLIERLPKIRLKAKEMNMKAQTKQKEYHDKMIKKNHEFEIGEKVLYYKAAKAKQWSGKLEEKWKGPYYIHEKMLNGSYKIKDMNGKILTTPVNGELLKKYFDRYEFEPMVVIT